MSWFLFAICTQNWKSNLLILIHSLKNFRHALSSLKNILMSYFLHKGFSDDLVGKKSVCNVGNTGDSSLIPGLGRSLGGGNGSPLQDSCLGNPMDREAWWVTFHGVAKSQTRLSTLAHMSFSSWSQKDGNLSASLSLSFLILKGIFLRMLNECRDSFKMNLSNLFYKCGMMIQNKEGHY